MATETVQAVRQAEINAAQQDKEAVKKREAILLKAKEDAEHMVSFMMKEANEKAETDLMQAEKQGEELMDAVVQRTEKEIILLKEMVKSKERAAIDLVLSEVI